jgi:N-acetylglucosaminyldiphosphoundecaprenol N-acetyl-beta-D-mannosaminyltransferase
MCSLVVKMKVDVSSLQDSEGKIINWATNPIGRYVCVSNVHMCMEVFDSPEYAKIVNGSDLTVADGKPIVWAQHLLGYTSSQQVRGTDLTLSLCASAEKNNISIGFYGATDELLSKLNSKLKDKFPELKVAYSFSPPFRPLTKEEDSKYVEAINLSGVQILFVALGCPKQEKWMAEHKNSVHCVTLGVGAAFDFIAGEKRHAPKWIQFIGFEWLYRLMDEPGRLWKRYLKHNPRFMFYFILQLLGKKSFD